jgi:hypothetical protein
MTLTRRSGLWLLPVVMALAAILAVAFWPSATGAAPAESLAAAEQRQSGRGLASFRSDEELRAFLRRAAERRAQPAESESMADGGAQAAPPTVSAPAAVTGSRVRSDGITNNQEAGVDEGGIVKNWGDMLVILRRGRLFTVSVAGGGMRPIDSINAFPPGVSGRGDWYDEMLVSGDRVIVIGYSYARGGTEVNRFRIAANGRLRFEDAYHLRSNDYYSSRNYASRLIGNRLVYYTPLYLGSSRGGDPLDALPGVRRWGRDGSTRSFRRIADARRVFIAPRLRDDEDADLSAMHSVISCDLTAPELDCDATAVIGPASRNFYVSSNAVYLHVNSGRESRDGRAAPATIYRLPFAETERPTAIGARGAPIDQFSFREDFERRRLDILLQPTGRGDGMWGPERGDGRGFALLQVPLDAFGDGSEEAERRYYRVLPPFAGDPYNLRNRFVGNYVLYGAAGSYGAPRNDAAVVAAPVGRGEATILSLPHGVDRIEVLGSDALVVGSMGRDLGFSAVKLGGRAPRLSERYVQRAAAEGESRSHAFYYNPDANSDDGDTGIVGLPIARPAESRYSRFFGSAAAMLFLRREASGFSPAGELDARPEGTVDDACQASCTDWYGNARPIFLRGRIFALLGYELVEGRMRGGRIGELRRVNFAPGGERRAERESFW